LGEVRARGPDGPVTVRAGVIVGADGIRSIVAREVGVARSVPFGRRVGLTWHIPDPAGDALHDARMVVVDGAYCGLAPVPGRRLNVGIVLAGRHRLRTLAARGATAVGAEILREVLGRDADRRPEPTSALGATSGLAPVVGLDPASMVLDRVAGAAPLGHRVSRRAGAGWLLVGDAAGFLDPFTGEGLHRALVSARLAADVLTERSTIPTDLSAYDRAMRQRFAAKDLVSLVVQAFLARPMLFEYVARRLARRERSRETLGMVMADLVPARRALDPVFLAALLAP
jgi:flavin-dependent dehydrogenase